MTDQLCIAHRGASGHEPENTLLAIQKALDLGAPWIEVDVHAVAGRVLVIHDNRLERTTSGTGALEDQELTYLRSLDAGKGERIPFLEEVLDLIGPRAGLNVELKGPRTAIPVARLLTDRLRQGTSHPDQLLVSSFDLRQLRTFRDLAPQIPLGVLLARTTLPYLKIAEELKASSLHVKLSQLTERLVAGAHAHGLRVYVFTVNTEGDLARVRHLGADGVFTDYPELLPP